MTKSKALATIGTGPMRPVLDLALTTFRPYGEKHGYEIVIGSGKSEGRGPAWAKVVLLQRLLGSFDEVLWLDSDILILDDTLDLAELVPSDSFQALVEQNISETERAPNTGVWFLRSCDRAYEFLSAVWGNRAEGEPGMWENLQALDLLGYSTVRPYRPVATSQWRDGTAFLDDEWNAMDPSQMGRFRHYSAMSNQERRLLMWLDLHANYRLARPLRRGAHSIACRWYSAAYFQRRIGGDSAP